MPEINRTRGTLANVTPTQVREQFLQGMLTVLGDTRLLWTPKATDTTTSLDESLTGRTLTHDATIASRLAPLGLGYYTTFDGAANYATTPDTANLSFGNSTVDQAFSIIALINLTNTATTKTVLSKSAGSNIEWVLQLASTEVLQLALFDQSVSASPSKSTDVAISTGAWVLVAATYSAANPGATAAAAMTMYVNGLAVAATGTEAGTYVAMENLTSAVEIGSSTAHTTAFFSGSMALVALCQNNLDASDHWNIKKLVNGYFGLSL